MGAGLIRRIVELAIGLAGLAMLIGISRAVIRLFSGQSSEVVWPVVTGSPATQALGAGASATWTHGSLVVANQPLLQWLDLIAQSVTLALSIWALVCLRRLVILFSRGEFLEFRNVADLRRIAMALLAICGVSLASALLLQPLLLASFETQGGVVMHPSLSWDVAGKTNVWLDYEVPIGTAMLAGLAALFAEALKSGIAYREDSEGVL